MVRWRTPDDVAHAVVAQATGGFPFATGMHIDIDGGPQMRTLKG